MALDIPRSDTESIDLIKSLPAASVEKFVAALKSAPPVSDYNEMAAYLATRLQAIPLGRLKLVMRTLYTLYHIRELSGVKAPRFLEDVLDGIRNSNHLKLSVKDLAKIRGTLERLMNIDSLNVISKAARLQRDGERLYCEAKILSDIRPVFGPEATAKPVGAVLTHTIKVGYHEGSDHKQFHIILDSEDLNALVDVVRRAQAKDKSLRELLEIAGLPNLGRVTRDDHTFSKLRQGKLFMGSRDNIARGRLRLRAYSSSGSKAKHDARARLPGSHPFCRRNSISGP